MKVNLNDIFSKVSDETGLSKSKIELAFKSIFELVADTMREKQGNTILIPRVGKFVIPPNKLKYVNNKKYNENIARDIRRGKKLHLHRSRSRGDSNEKVGDL